MDAVDCGNQYLSYNKACSPKALQVLSRIVVQAVFLFCWSEYVVLVPHLLIECGCSWVHYYFN